MTKYIVTGELVIMGHSQMLKKGATFDGDKYRKADVKRQLKFGNIKSYIKPKTVKADK
jgi:hypothetical protein